MRTTGTGWRTRFAATTTSWRRTCAATATASGQSAACTQSPTSCSTWRNCWRRSTGFPVRIVAHSLGANIALHYTGFYPENVHKLVAIEGMGPPPRILADRANAAVDERMRGWVGNMQKLAGRQPRRYPSLDAAADRMQEVNGFLSPEQARHLTVNGMARNEDGTYTWKFDNYVRSFPPYRYDEEELQSIWGRITCPTLLVRGTESWASDPVEDGRIEAFQNAELRNFEGAGHWVHHDQLDEFVTVARDFLAD